MMKEKNVNVDVESAVLRKACTVLVYAGERIMPFILR
jgi:hypothetical protein